MGFAKASTQRWLAFAAALAAAFALLPATGGEARKKTCKVRGSHTSFQTKHLRVYSIFRGSNTGTGSSKYFACYRKNGRKTKLGVQNGPKQTHTWKPVGRFLPYLNSLNVGTRDISRDFDAVRLLDVRSGKLKFAATMFHKHGDAAGLLATPSGGIAFIVDERDDADELDTTERFVVGHKAGTGQHAYSKLTASFPPDVDPSLKRKGDVVSWRIRDERTFPTSYITGSADLGR